MPSQTDRADLVTVRRLVYENLGITNQSTGYGNLATNKRYPTQYIDDAIAQADFQVMSILLKSKQFLFDTTFFTRELLASTVHSMPQNSAVYSVYFYTSNSDATQVDRGKEVTWPVYDMIKDGGIFTSDPDYKGFFTIQDGKVYSIPYSARINSKLGYVDYIKLNHLDDLSTLDNNKLYSPDGFEPAIAMYASAVLLMKRADNPEQSNFYMQRFAAEMQVQMSPATSAQRQVNE